MRFIQFMKKGLPSLAVWNESLQAWLDIAETLPAFPVSSVEIFSMSEDRLSDLKCLVNGTYGTPLNLKELQFLPPVLNPSKLLCVGLNYADHAEEFKDPIPKEPVFFNKIPTTLNAHLGDIMVPRVSYRIDYEAELVIVIGKKGKHISRETAMDYVGGYTCGNDVSCRDWQKNKPAGQWFLGKSFDSFAPIGPELVLKDEIANPNKLHIESRLNGRVMQSSNTKNFIFPVEELIAYISQVMTLLPGDLIFTGTPGGIGDRREPPVYLKSGDSIEVEIEGIGILRNSVIEE